MKKGVDYIGVAVGMMLVNDAGEVFLAQRGLQSKNEAGKRELSGGGVDHGESREDAVKREAKEAFDVDVEIVDVIGVFDHILPDEGHHWVSTTYLCKIAGDSPVPKILEPEKCSAIKWVVESEIDMDELSEMAKMVVLKYRKNNFAKTDESLTM